MTKENVRKVQVSAGKIKKKTGIILPLSYIIVLFYTQSFTRNRQQVQDILCYGVENVGDFFTFFVGKGGDGPEVAKHRTSLMESTDVLHQKYRCFHQRSPIFLFSDFSEQDT